MLLFLVHSPHKFAKRLCSLHFRDISALTVHKVTHFILVILGLFLCVENQRYRRIKSSLSQTKPLDFRYRSSAPVSSPWSWSISRLAWNTLLLLGSKSSPSPSGPCSLLLPLSFVSQSTSKKLQKIHRKYVSDRLHFREDGDFLKNNFSRQNFGWISFTALYDCFVPREC